MPEKEEPTSKIMGLWHLLLFLLLLFCVLLFITLPLLAGIGGTLWMFGPDAAREPVGFSTLPWAVGSLVGTFLITQFVESKIKKYSNARKFTAEVASMQRPSAYWRCVFRDSSAPGMSACSPQLYRMW